MSDTLKFRRVVFSVPYGAVDEAAARLAADFAGQLGIELHGLFVENTELRALGALPFVRELRFLEGGWSVIDAERLAMEAMLAMDRARRRFFEIGEAGGTKPLVTVAHTSPAEAIASASRAGDIVIIGESRDAIEAVGSFPAELIEAALGSAASVLFVPRRVARRRGPIVVIAKHPTETGVGVGLSLAQSAKARLVIANPGEALGAEWESLEALVAAGADIRPAPGIFGPAASDFISQLGLELLDERLVIVTRGVLESSLAAALAEQRHVPVLIAEAEET